MSSILDDMRYFFYRRSVKGRKPDEIARESLHFSEVKTVGIIFDATDISVYESVRSFKKLMESKSKKVKILAYIDANNANSLIPFDMISRKDLNWKLKPTSPIAEQFTNTNFDLLVNAYLKVSPPLEYISTFSAAKFRVGLHFPDNTGLSDMMLSINENPPTLGNFFAEVNRCLNIYQTNNG